LIEDNLARAQSIEPMLKFENFNVYITELANTVIRLFVIVICAMAVTDCSCITCSRMISQSANSKKFAELKSRTLISPPANHSIISQTANTEKFTDANSRIPIPLPAAPLLSPQPEPSCEFNTTDINANERQKLDYERQCYRHAEMIVRGRLQLLQDSVAKTISAVKHSEGNSP
jgi:hypothetical protein